jgi:ATP-binding cassette subfamily B protein
VGKTGSGKSTLVSLVPRLIDASDGDVLVDDVPVRRYRLEDLRRAIGFVPQETFLFSDSIAENIAFGIERFQVTGSTSQVVSQNGGPTSNLKPVTSDDPKETRNPELIRAAEIAGLASDIEGFQYGYEQRVGERGITLSGGQKQRTAIARAVMRDPRILILDDSLSAVDTYTEEQILGNLREVRENRTTLIVAHRVSTIKDADLICVLSGGEIIERGSHDELLARGGEYADLYQLQLLEEELDLAE